MKKKEARKLVPGDKLVMVCAGSYSAGFEAGDAVSFVGPGEDPRLSVSGLYEGREITQTISRKDVELYTEPNETPVQPERPHEELRATYKAGQEWEFKHPDMPDWRDCLNWGGLGPTEPQWYADFEYRLKPETTKPQTRREQLIEAGVPEAALPAGQRFSPPELYCVVFGDDNRMCSLSGSESVYTGALVLCNQLAERLRRYYPDEKYRIMRMTPVDSGEG